MRPPDILPVLMRQEHTMYANLDALHDAVPTHNDAGTRIPPTRYTVTHRDLGVGPRMPYTDANDRPMGANNIDMALVYARHLSERFQDTEYAVFDQLEGDHLSHFYVRGEHYSTPHRAPQPVATGPFYDMRRETQGTDHLTYDVSHDDGVTTPGIPSKVGTVVRLASNWWVAYHWGEHLKPGYGFAATNRTAAVDLMLRS